MSTHNLCFGAKIRKIVYPCIPQFNYIKVGFKGVFIAWSCFPDDPRLRTTQPSKSTAFCRGGNQRTCGKPV